MKIPDGFPPEFIDLIRAEIETGEIVRLRAALAKSDPIVRVFDGTLPVLECLYCGGRRGHFSIEVEHTNDCVWVLAQRSK